MSSRVQSVAIVGRDAPVWLTAAALRRSLGSTGLRVHVVELPRLRASVDAYAAVPSLAAMHRLLGLEERIVLGACRGVPMTGQRFSNWAQGGSPYLLAYDDEPPPGGDLPFTQYWVKGALEGLRVGFDDFSLGNACARLGRVPAQAASDAPVSASYGYHLDALAYSELAKALALRLGAEVASAGVRNVDIESDRIAGIDLADGTRLTADLYVDATGSEAALIGNLPGAEFESWGEWLPCDRLLATSAPRLQNLPAFSQISAFRGGWVGLFPLQSRTAVVAAYGSPAVADDEMVEQLSVIARLPVQGDAVVSALNQGIRRKAWIGNCIAVGEAAIAVDPIDALDLHVTHGCISYLMTAFPVTADQFPEAEAYNASVHRFGCNLRDFQAAHYKLNRRFDDPFWDAARDAMMPESLERRIGLFDARAIVTLYDDESFHEQSWAALFLGCGLMPKGYDPRIDAVPDEAHIQKVQQRLRDVAQIAKQMPTVDELVFGQTAAAQVSQ